MKISEITTKAASSWSPCHELTNLIATGSITGSLEDFSSSSTLEFYSTTYDSSQPNKLGSIQASDRFTRLSWGISKSPYGILAGALSDGNIALYSPEAIIKNEGKSLLATLDKHSGPVRGLAFNSLQNNVMASAGDDSVLYIWNLLNPESPVSYSPEGKNPHANQTISSLAWNKAFEYIIATTSHYGLSVIWDLKQKKPIVSLASPTAKEKRRYSSVAWNPEQPTQLIVGCEDDSSPVIEYWDLRHAYEPLKEFKDGHSKGILSLSWCPDDSNILVSGGKDNKSVIWNPNTGELLGELPPTKSWVYDVQWSYRPSVLSTSSFDGVSVYSLQDSSAEVSNEEVGFSGVIGKKDVQKKKNIVKTVPKWLKRPVGASFGFGGKMVTFVNGNPVVQIERVSTDEIFTKRCIEFEKAITTGDVKSFCEFKVNTCNQKDKQIWEVIQLSFEQNLREKLMKYFGFDKTQISTELKEIIEKAETITEEVKESKTISNEKADELIQKSLMIGDYETAVEVSFLALRFDDALLLSTYGGPKLWEASKNRYLTQKKNSVTNLLNNLNVEKLENLVSTSNLDKWKETLATICSFGKDKFTNLTDLLGKRLETEKFDVQSSLVCYILSQNVDKVVSIWLNELANQSTEDKDSLLDLMEKVAIFQLKKPIQKIPSDLVEKYSTFASILASQGLFNISLKYLNMVHSSKPDSNPQSEFNHLRYRVYHAVDKPFGEEPKSPFKKIQVVEEKKVEKKIIQQEEPSIFPPKKEEPKKETPVKRDDFLSGPMPPVKSEFVKGELPPIKEQNDFIRGELPPMKENPKEVEKRDEEERNFYKAPVKVVKQEQISTITFDISSIPEENHNIATTLNKGYEVAFSGTVTTADAQKKRMIESGLLALYKELSEKKYNSELLSDLTQICQKIQNQDYGSSDKMIKKFSENYWEETKPFIKGLKFLNQILKEKL